MKLTLLLLLSSISSFCFGQWNLATTFPNSGVALPFCFTISGKAYLGSGFDSSENVTVNNYEYNPISNNWTQKSTPPFIARMGAFNFSIGNYGYVGSGSTNGGANVLTDFWRYDPVTDNWTAMATFPGVGRIAAATFVINGKGYVISGVNSAGFPIDCWEYNPTSNTWNAMTNPPTGFTPGYVIGFTNGILGYVGIGFSNNDFWKFDPVLNLWTQLASLPAVPTTRTFCVGGTGFELGKGFVGLGGFNSFDNVDFWSYDISADSWQVMGSSYNFPYCLANGLTFNLNGTIYVGTGFKAGLQFSEVENKIYKYPIVCSNNLTITSTSNSLPIGSNAIITATTSDPNPIFTWQSDFGQGFQTLNNFGNYSGANTATLNIANVQLPNHTQPIRVISTSGNCIDTSNVAVINILDTCLVTVYDTLLTTVTDTLVINALITGINPPNNLNILKVFPNPASTHITIDYGNFNSMSGYTLQIVNSFGQTIFTTPINQQTSYIDLSTWTGNGIYFVQLIDPQNNTIENRKIVIQ
jgi:N-acetylneuraminic acid mutarotase